MLRGQLLSLAALLACTCAYEDMPAAPQAMEPEVVASEGGTVTLRCLFHGNPKPKIKWKFRAHTIDGNAGRYRLISDGALEIYPLYRSDTGAYTCVADNSLGVARQEVHLVVNAPHQAVPQKELVASEGGIATLRCLFPGNTPPKITWKFQQLGCDKLCDEGKQTRLAMCYQTRNDSIEVMDDENCTEEKPEEEQPCVLQHCDAVDWVTSSWSGCDSCTSKFRTRTMVCATKTGHVLNEKFCSHLNRPADYEECHKDELPVCEIRDATWYATKWSKCSVNCGDGVQTRKVFCGMYYDNENGEGVDVVEDAFCANLTKYNDIKPCTVPKEECPSQWFAGPWSACSEACGGGTQYRRVMCFQGDKKATDCNGTTVLDSAQLCNIGPCHSKPTELTTLEASGSFETSITTDVPSYIVSKDKDLPTTTTVIRTLKNVPAVPMVMALQRKEPDVTGSEDAEITIDGNAGRYRVMSDGALEIVSLYRKDTGVYICEADNGLGVATQEVQLTVNVPVRMPVGIAGDENATVIGELNSPLHVRCLAYGYPSPFVFWYRDYEEDMALYNDAKYEVRGNDLIFRSLSRDTLGQYSCRAYNGVGKMALWGLVVRAYKPKGLFDENKWLVPRVTPRPRTPTTTTTTTNETLKLLFTETSTAGEFTDTTEETMESFETNVSSTTNEDTTDVVGTTTLDPYSGFEFDCCANNETEASGPDGQGCPCNATEFGCCPDGVSPESSTVGGLTETTEEITELFETSEPSTTNDVTIDVFGTFTLDPCSDFEFGCCADNETEASGPDGQGCPCNAAEFGSCPDGVSPDPVRMPVGIAGDDNATVIGELDTLLHVRCQAYGYPAPYVFWFRNYEEDMALYNNTEYEVRGNDLIFRNLNIDTLGQYSCRAYNGVGKRASWGLVVRAYKPVGFFSENKWLVPRDTTTTTTTTTEAPGLLFTGLTETTEEITELFETSEPSTNNDVTTDVFGTFTLDPCSGFEFGCCADNETEASGPDGQGCPCNATEFGSCPDSVLPVPDKCTLPAETGECSNYRTRWFYDTTFKTCRQFYYGGCGGNENNFGTEAECDNSCSEIKTTTTATITTTITTVRPVEPQPQPRPAEPEQMPAAPEISEFCFNAIDAGPCNNTTTRYAYDSDLGRCVTFQYGGCGGNQNNFPEEAYCSYYCQPMQDICQLPMLQGPCEDSLMRWFYDPTTDSCSQFTYGGCEGNDNRFESLEACENRCRTGPAPVVPTIPITTVIVNGPSECRVPEALEDCRYGGVVWYFDPSRHECVSHANQEAGPVCRYTGTFLSQEACERSCGAFRGVEVCKQRKDPGPCQSYVTKVYFDPSTGQCHDFIYGGCLGGANRFSTMEECSQVCKAEIADPCSLPPERGNCFLYVQQWYYDSSRDQCNQFVYTGCSGNENRFETQADCESRCKRPAPTTTTMATPPQQLAEPECKTPSLLEPCGNNVTVFYYDSERRECLISGFGGCGHPNTYRTEEECERTCGAFRGMETNEVHDCDEYVANCSRLRCEYGIQRTRLPDGCEKCWCVQVEIDCEPLKQECDQIKCNYGIERTIGTDGCETCKCKEYPCERKSCEAGERCVVQPYMNGLDPEPKFIALCRPIVKAGACPVDETTSNEVTCRRECSDDADCRGVSKCCRRGCSDICLVTVEQTSPPPLLTSTTTIAPNIPAAPQALPLQEPEVSASEGGTAILRCLIHGNPPPRITWTFGELTIDDNAGRYRLKSDGALEIVSLYRNDAGVYICLADNGLGVATQEVHLVVNDPVRMPAGIAGDENAAVTGELGRPLHLRCLAYGYPPPSVFWYRGYENVMVPYNDRVYEARGNVLLIRSLAIDTLGQYTCQAYNGEGKPASWVVFVRAYQPEGLFIDNELLVPRNTVVPRPWTQPPTTAERTTTTTSTTTEAPRPLFTVPVSTHVSLPSPTLNIGDDLHLTCEIDGFPEPDVHWTKDGRTIQTDDRITITGSTIVSRLTVMRLSVADSGLYACHASNLYSSQSDTAQINVQQLVVPAKCTDNPWMANCDLIVRSMFCKHKYYSKFCCKSCVEAGQLDPQEAELQADQPLRKK